MHFVLPDWQRLSSSSSTSVRVFPSTETVVVSPLDRSAAAHGRAFAASSRPPWCGPVKRRIPPSPYIVVPVRHNTSANRRHLSQSVRLSRRRPWSSSCCSGVLCWLLQALLSRTLGHWSRRSRPLDAPPSTAFVRHNIITNVAVSSMTPSSTSGTVGYSAPPRRSTYRGCRDLLC